MTSNEYERLAFEREMLKEKYEAVIQKNKFIEDVKASYKKDLAVLYVKPKEKSKIRKFFDRLFKVI